MTSAFFGCTKYLVRTFEYDKGRKYFFRFPNNCTAIVFQLYENSDQYQLMMASINGVAINPDIFECKPNMFYNAEKISKILGEIRSKAENQ